MKSCRTGAVPKVAVADPPPKGETGRELTAADVARLPIPQVYHVQTGSIRCDQGAYVLHLDAVRDGQRHHIALRLTRLGIEQLADQANGALSA